MEQCCADNQCTYDKDHNVCGSDPLNFSQIAANICKKQKQKFDMYDCCNKELSNLSPNNPPVSQDIYDCCTDADSLCPSPPSPPSDSGNIFQKHPIEMSVIIVSIIIIIILLIFYWKNLNN